MDQAHKEAHAVEEVLINHFEDNAGVLVHMDPCDERLCPVCQNSTCQWRKKTFASKPVWDRRHLVRSLKER